VLVIAAIALLVVSLAGGGWAYWSGQPFPVRVQPLEEQLSGSITNQPRFTARFKGRCDRDSYYVPTAHRRYCLILLGELRERAGGPPATFTVDADHGQVTISADQIQRLFALMSDPSLPAGRTFRHLVLTRDGQPVAAVSERDLTAYSVTEGEPAALRIEPFAALDNLGPITWDPQHPGVLWLP